MKKLFGYLFIGLTIFTVGCAEAHQEEIALANTQQEFAKGERKDVSVEEFDTFIASTNGTVLDVRTPEEWANGTIKGAIKINFYDDNFKSKIADLNRTNPVYVYCKLGGRSGKAATQMAEMGFTVYNLLGGITAWKNAGKSMDK